MTFLREAKAIAVTGHRGFLGRHLVQELIDGGVSSANIRRVSRETGYDLTKPDDAAHALHMMDVVFHLAANVGGIGKNQQEPANLYVENSRMGENVVESSIRENATKLIAVGTVCSYPKVPPHIPFREEDLFNGFPEKTNSAYGEAKRGLLVYMWAAREQYGLNGIYLLPTNMYGPGDNFGSGAHVIPDMIRKFVEARERNLPKVVLWGDGTPTREFLHVRDAARGIVLAGEVYNDPEPVNLGSGVEVTMRQLAEKIAVLTRYTGSIGFDTSKPNGQPKRILDITRAKEKLGYAPQEDFNAGLAETVEYYERDVLCVERNR